MKPYYDDGKGIVIWNADCRDVLPTLEPGSMDLVPTDPPYGISVEGLFHVGQPGKGTRRLDFFPGDTDWSSMTDLATGVIVQCLLLLSDAASVYVWVGHRQFGALVALLEGKGFSTRSLVWAKEYPPPPAPGSGWPSGAELCVYGYRPGRTWTHREQNTPRSNVLRADSFRHGQPGKVNHPTQKPISVVAPLILASSFPDHSILDPFMGSGTTLVAAQALGRRAIGVEICEEYCQLAVERLRQMPLPLTVSTSHDGLSIERLRQEVLDL